MKGAEQAMNGFGESLSSLDKASDFGGSCLASPMLPHGMGGSAGGAGGEDQLYSLYGGSDQDQRYPSNTISSTSSTRSNGAQAAGGSSKFGGGGKQQTGNLLSVGGGKGGSKSSKSKTSKQQQQQQQELSKGGHHPVSSLDMQRINRYGTIPKGAQINAYLDSLRQDEEAAAAAAALDLHNEAHLFAVDAALNQQNRFHDDMAVGHGLGMPMVPPLPSPSLFSGGGQGTSTFAKEQQQRNVAILEDISNQHHHHPPHHAKTKSSDDSLSNHHQQFNLQQQQQFQNQQQPSSSHHFNFTRQKSDLTHSKTSENVSGGNQSSKSGRTSQLRGQKTANHLHLLKAVASPRLQGSKAGGGGGGGLLESSNHQFSLDQQTYPPPPPLHSSSGAVPAHFAGFRNDIVDQFSAGQQQQQQPQFPMPPAQFCNQVDANFDGYHHHQKALAKSDSFDFVSGLNAAQQQQSVELIPLDALISSEDFPPPPPANQLCPEEEEEEAAAANLELDQQQQQQQQPINNNATKVDGTKESKKPKKPPKEEKKSKKEAKAEAKAKAAAATSTVSTFTSSTTNTEGAGKSSSQQQQQQQPNSAFMSELYESFRQKAAAKATADTSKGDATSDGKSSSANLISSSSKTATTAKETTAKAAAKNLSATTSASSRASFLFKSRSTSIKPEPNCPAPAVPTLAVNLSQSKFYTKDFVDAKSGTGDNGKGLDSSAANGDAAANAGGGASVEAEYVTPVQKRTQHPQLLRSQLETAKTNDQQVGSSEAVDAVETVTTTATTTTTTPAATSKPKKPSKIAMLFNGGGSKSSKESKAAKAADLKSSKAVEAAAAQAEEDHNQLLSKSTISNSGYDADDECKRGGGQQQQQPPLNSYKKFWESQSSGSAAAAEADSGLGSCASSNAATSKSNDSVISVGSFGSASSAKQQQATAAAASPKLGARGLNSSSKIPVGTSTLFSKKTPSPNSKSLSAAADGNSGSVDNIPQKCAKEEASASQESKPTLVFSYSP